MTLHGNVIQEKAGSLYKHFCICESGNLRRFRMYASGMSRVCYKSKFPKQINYWMTMQIAKRFFILLNIYCVSTLAKTLSKYGLNLIYRKPAYTVLCDTICWVELPLQSIRKFWGYWHTISKIFAYVSGTHSVVTDLFITTRNLVVWVTILMLFGNKGSSSGSIVVICTIL